MHTASPKPSTSVQTTKDVKKATQLCTFLMHKIQYLVQNCYSASADLKGPI